MINTILNTIFAILLMSIQKMGVIAWIALIWLLSMAARIKLGVAGPTWADRLILQCIILSPALALLHSALQVAVVSWRKKGGA